MEKQSKIDSIVRFVTDNPQSTASRAILRRLYLNNYNYETSQELGIQLKNALKKEKGEEIDFCFYLVK